MWSCCVNQRAYAKIPAVPLCKPGHVVHHCWNVLLQHMAVHTCTQVHTDTSTYFHSPQWRFTGKKKQSVFLARCNLISWILHRELNAASLTGRSQGSSYLSGLTFFSLSEVTAWSPLPHSAKACTEQISAFIGSVFLKHIAFSDSFCHWVFFFSTRFSVVSMKTQLHLFLPDKPTKRKPWSYFEVN